MNPIVCASERKFVNPEIVASNNRIKSDQDGDSVDDYVFDLGGNTTKDVDGRTFVYDAENKQVSVSDANGTIGEYFYDGDGKRIKKIVPSTGEITVFVYDAAGKLIGEYSTVVASSQDAKVAYLTADNLGSPRINTDQYGAVIARHDYHPFGEEIFSAERTTTLGYTADTIRKQFTGYERDDETDLDFEQARMYNSNIGRFLIADPIFLLNERLVNPQQINLFTYCRNSPSAYVDPSGMKLDPTTWKKNAQNAFKTYLEKLESDPKKYAAELDTISQLKKSDVNYILQTDESGKSFPIGTEGGVTTNGKDVFVNIANQGNGKENFSRNSNIGHEFEHARQFDSGEWGFASDSNGNFMSSSGEFIGTRVGVDITDEIKAWSVSVNLATSSDNQVKGGHSDPDFQVRILPEFEKSSNKGEFLTKISVNYLRMAKTG